MRINRGMRDVDKKILKELSTDRPVNLKELGKRSGISYKILIERIEYLQDQGYIRIERIGPQYKITLSREGADIKRAYRQPGPEYPPEDQEDDRSNR